MNRYVIGLLACIGLAILLAILLFTGGHKAAPSNVVSLPSYANTNAQVKLVQDGPIVAPQNHNTMIITVDQYTANFQLIQGYNGNVISSKIYNNSENSFKNFLYALYYAGFSQGMASNYKNDLGLCSTGDRYDFYLTENGQTLQHYWITGCSSNPKTFNGNFGLTMHLFETQIPDFNNLTSNANI
ncbi:MAG: hypothetical protein ACYCPS_02020 [Candidatus Saccharimonadales bacterium]